jgi:hypothetical protein
MIYVPIQWEHIYFFAAAASAAAFLLNLLLKLLPLHFFSFLSDFVLMRLNLVESLVYYYAAPNPRLGSGNLSSDVKPSDIRIRQIVNAFLESFNFCGAL